MDNDNYYGLILIQDVINYLKLIIMLVMDVVLDLKLLVMNKVLLLLLIKIYKINLLIFINFVSNDIFKGGFNKRIFLRYYWQLVTKFYCIKFMELYKKAFVNYYKLVKYKDKWVWNINKKMKSIVINKLIDFSLIIVLLRFIYTSTFPFIFKVPIHLTTYRQSKFWI